MQTHKDELENTFRDKEAELKKKLENELKLQIEMFNN